jgi:hypothetical protein
MKKIFIGLFLAFILTSSFINPEKGLLKNSNKSKLFCGPGLRVYNEFTSNVVTDIVMTRILTNGAPGGSSAYNNINLQPQQSIELIGHQDQSGTWKMTFTFQNSPSNSWIYFIEIGDPSTEKCTQLGSSTQVDYNVTLPNCHDNSIILQNDGCL